MNSLIYNFSVIILLVGFSLMIHHTTKIYYQNNTRIEYVPQNNVFDTNTYQQRPNSRFKRMFNEIGPWIDSRPNVLPQEDFIKKNRLL